MYTGYRIERRKFKRLNVNLSVLIRVMAPRVIMEQTKGQEFEAKTVDLSRGGMALVSSQSLPVGTQLFCKFIVYEHDHVGAVNFYQIVTVFAHVRSMSSLDQTHYRLGLYFEELDEEKEEKIRDMMACPMKYESPARFPSRKA